MLDCGVIRDLKFATYTFENNSQGKFMLQIMFACVRTGQFVPTGIETDLDTFMALPEVLSLSQCPACGGSHYWTKSETWISDSLRKCPAALPADTILPRH